MSKEAPESQPPPGTPAPRSSLAGILPLLLVAIVLGAIIFYWPSSQPEPLSRLNIQPLDADAPAITLADLQGKVVLLNLWGTWCPPCRLEFPHLVEIYKKYKDHQDFRLLAVSCGPPGSDEDIETLRRATQAFLDQNDSPMPAYTDPGQVTRSAINEAVGLQGYPTTILLGVDNSIERVWVGYAPGAEKEMESAIAGLLGK